MLRGFSFLIGGSMNRKQKKAKRLRATQHTKKQDQINMTPHEQESLKQWYAYGDEVQAEIDESFEPPKNTAIWAFVIVLICMFITLWMIKINT